MKKILKLSIGIVIGMIIATTTIVCAFSFDSVDIKHTKVGGSDTSVSAAISELYQMRNAGTASASDILPGKTAWINGVLVTGTYQAPDMNIVIDIGNQSNTVTNNQTRVFIDSYRSLYKYFKVTAVNKIDYYQKGTGYFINSNINTYSTNLTLNTDYLLSDYDKVVCYTSGSPGYFYRLIIQVHN